VSFGVVGAGVLVLALVTRQLWIVSPDRDDYPVRGVDVSHHQGEIDWLAVASDDVSFAYIKATEGGDFRDPLFKSNWEGAGDAGLTRGAYHFFTFCRSGAAQADNVISTVPRAEHMLPLVVDLELGGNCARRPSAADFAADLSEFTAAVEHHYGWEPVRYLTTEFIEAYPTVVVGRPVWIRSVFGTPRLPDGQPWLFWQFNPRGRVQGVSGPVDLNVFGGSPTQFVAMSRGRPPAELWR
jgi:lysozyme